MVKSEQSSTMIGGLCMDLDPLVTPNDVMTSCLNGTFLTYNGNESILQNEMGNVRVESATLPKGYVPVGTVQHGGIIYIASYNPENKLCQLGSFPSPERNFTPNDSDETLTYDIENKDFIDNSNNVKITKILIPLTKDDLYPGDLYKVFFKNWNNKYAQVLSAVNDPNEDIYGTVRYIKLSFATINDQGKLIYLNDYIHWDDFEIKNNDNTTIKVKYYISPKQKSFDENKSTYNVFSGQEKGKLYVVAELEIIDDFSVSWDATRYTDEEGRDKVNLTLYANWISERLKNKEVINPEYIDIEYSLVPNISVIDKPIAGGSEDISVINKVEFSTIQKTVSVMQIAEYDNNEEWNIIPFKTVKNRKNDGTDEDYKLITLKNLDVIKNQILKIDITPRMSYGRLKHLQKAINIDLNKINSGLIKLLRWQYFKSSNNINLEFYIDAYPKKDREIASLSLEFYKVTKDNINNCIDNYNNLKISGSNLNGKNSNPDKVISIINNTSYSRDYQEIIYFDDSFTPESCYQVDLVANYVNGDSEIVDRRILYTTEQFNNNKAEDYGELTLNDGLYLSLATQGVHFNYYPVKSVLQKEEYRDGAYNWYDVVDSLYYKDINASEKLRIQTNINDTEIGYTIIPAIRYIGDTSIESSLFTFTAKGITNEYIYKRFGDLLEKDKDIPHYKSFTVEYNQGQLELKKLMKHLTYPDHTLFLNYICYKSEGNWLTLDYVLNNTFGSGLAFHKIHEKGDKGTVAYQFYKITEINDYIKASDEYEYDVIPLQFIIHKKGRFSNGNESGDASEGFPNYMASILKNGTVNDHGSNSKNPSGNMSDSDVHSSYISDYNRSGFLLMLCKNKVGDLIPLYVTKDTLPYKAPPINNGYDLEAEGDHIIPFDLPNYYKLLDNDDNIYVNNKYIAQDPELDNYYIEVNPKIEKDIESPNLFFNGFNLSSIQGLTIPKNFKFSPDTKTIQLDNAQQYKVDARKLIDEYILTNNTVGVINKDNVPEIIPNSNINYTDGKQIFLLDGDDYIGTPGLSFAKTNSTPPKRVFTKAVIVDDQVRLDSINANQSKVLLRSTLDDETIKIYLAYGK